MMSTLDQLEILSKKIDNLVQIGTICEVDSKNRALARVTILGRVTDFLPVFSMSSKFKKHWIPPRVKEQVMVISPFGSGQSGVILRGIFNKNCREPSDSLSSSEVVEYEDGTKIKYDSIKKVLELDCSKDILIKLKGDLNIELSGFLKIVKDSNELITLLSSLLETLINARTPTMLGPQPFMGNILSEFKIIKEKLDLFKC
jgi:phage baseplate assembly protein V